MKNPGKDLPTAIVGGLSAVMAVYIIINLAYLRVARALELALVTSPAILADTRLFGDVGDRIITIGILISVFGTLNGYLLTGPSISYTLAKQKIIPGSDALSKVNSGGSPTNATLLVAILACIYALYGQFNLLTDLTIFMVWVFYIFTFIGVMKVRKDSSNLDRPYKVPLYPVITLIALTGGLFAIVNQLLTSTLIALGGIIITLIGLPVYNYMSKKNDN